MFGSGSVMRGCEMVKVMGIWAVGRERVWMWMREGVMVVHRGVLSRMGALEGQAREVSRTLVEVLRWCRRFRRVCR